MATNSMKKKKSTESSGSKKEPPTDTGLLSFRGLGKRLKKEDKQNEPKNTDQQQIVLKKKRSAESQQVQPKSEFKDEANLSIAEIIKRKTGIEAPSVIEQREKKRQEKQKLKQEPKKDEKSLLNLQIKDEQRTQSSVREEKAQQRDQFDIVNGQLVKIKADSVSHTNSYQCVVMDPSKKRPTQNTYLRQSKRQKSSKWGGSNDEQKFYDALKVFGGDIGMIHSCVFCPKEAQPKYIDTEYFSERSVVQLKNKFRKEQDKIYKMIDRKKKHEDMQWFEKKYGIKIMCQPSSAQAPVEEDKLSDDNVTDSSGQDDQSQAILSSMEQYASHMSAGLISDRGIAEYTKSLKSNSKYQTSLKSEK